LPVLLLSSTKRVAHPTDTIKATDTADMLAHAIEALQRAMAPKPADPRAAAMPKGRADLY
jgi:hypothetical protein